MNIFEVIDKTTRSIEPFHSRYFSDALEASFKGDQSLFSKFWSMATESDSGWPIPSAVEVTAEYVLDSGRVDIVIVDTVMSRCLAIEIKTSESSTTEGQLTKYQSSLENLGKFSEVRMVYLTPFNIENSNGELTNSILEFKSFAEISRNSVHLSWLEIASIDWIDGGELWQQHREYIRNAICVKRDSSQRQLDAFFSPLELATFWDDVASAGGPVGAGVIDLASISDIQRFVGAIRSLINSPRNLNTSVRINRISDEVIARNRSSVHCELHNSIMALCDEYPWVWVQGKKNYGLRVARPGISGGLSLCTFGDSSVRIGQLR
ncbi:MAG: PD-(D/E)XK nuclease family protein [Chloroflexi bacterium]|nr:PD-(D/E)XK nuclease family protein [Chloroflexota bacterium]